MTIARASIDGRREGDDFQTPKSRDAAAALSDAAAVRVADERDTQTVRTDVGATAVTRAMEQLRTISKEVDANAWMFRGPRSNPS